MEDSITFECASCQREIKSSAANAGKRGKCPKCGAAMTIPALDSGADWGETLEPVARRVPTGSTGPISNPPTVTSRQTTLKRLGVILILLGAAIAIFFWQFFDVSVEVPDFMGQKFGTGRVNNFGLMQERQNGLLGGMGISAAGFVLVVLSLIFSQKQSASVSPTPAPLSIDEQIRMLAKLKADGLINDEEFNQKKRQFLGLDKD